MKARAARRAGWLGAGLVTGVVAGAAWVFGVPPTTGPGPLPPASSSTPAVSSAPTLQAGACRLRGEAPKWLPDPACTPGAWNPQVSQLTIGWTICSPGWSTKARHAASLSTAFRARIVAAYGDAFDDGEFDHLVPISLGGAVRDERNVWVEPGEIPNPKDRVEAAARAAVCSGRLPLDDARRQIAVDWIALGHRLGVSGL